MSDIVLRWWQDDPEFMGRRWDHYDPERSATMTFADGRRLTLTYVRDFGPVCGAPHERGSVCSLRPGHECPHLASTQHYVTDLGERTLLSITKPRVIAP